MSGSSATFAFEVTDQESPKRRLQVSALSSNPTLIPPGGIALGGFNADRTLTITPAQVLLRWSIQLGNVVISRSANPERIVSNFDVFGFELTDEEMTTLNGLDEGKRFRPDPETYAGP